MICAIERRGTLDTVTITINETVQHPGHYRVVLSTTGQSGLPADPPVTAVAGDPCGSTVIQAPPVFPVLADGELLHTAAFSTPQTFTVTLARTHVTCTNCTLQVAEFMSNHGLNNPGGCFYHHCANISIQPDGGAGPVEPGRSDSGCGCAVGDARVSLVAVMSMVVLAARRRTPARGASRRARNRRAHRGEAAIPEVAVIGNLPAH